MAPQADTNTALPRAILIDLDDTILDFGSSVEPTWRAVCDEAARQAEGLDSQGLFEAVSRTRDWYWSDTERHREGRMNLRDATRDIVHQALTGLGVDLPVLAQDIAESYRALREAHTRPFPEAIGSLVRLRGLGIRLGLTTNGAGPGQRAKLDRFGLPRLFDNVLIEGEFGVGKPDRRVYLSSMEALGSRPGETWCVGDNLEWEVEAPQRLGIHGVWVDSAGKGLPPGAGVTPDRVIRSLEELP